jgi:hypothetical protein
VRQPRDVIAFLSGLCVHGLTRRQFQILGACALGYSTDEIAAGLCLSKPTIFRHIEILEERIFQTTEVTGTRHLLAAWTYAQRDCCAMPTWKMIENDQLFENGYQRHGP